MIDGNSLDMVVEDVFSDGEEVLDILVEINAPKRASTEITTHPSPSCLNTPQPSSVGQATLSLPPKDVSNIHPPPAEQTTHCLLLEDKPSIHSLPAGQATLCSTQKKETNIKAMKLCAAVEEARRTAIKQKQTKPTNKPTPTIVLDDSPVSPEKCWLKNEIFRLRHSHLGTIKSGQWLTDEIIHAAQKVLAYQFQVQFKEAGFQDPVLSQNMSFGIETSIVEETF